MKKSFFTTLLLLILTTSFIPMSANAYSVSSAGGSISALRDRHKHQIAEVDQAMQTCVDEKLADQSVNCTEIAAKAHTFFLEDMVRSAFYTIDDLHKTDVTIPCKARDIADEVCQRVSAKLFTIEALMLIRKIDDETKALQTCSEAGYTKSVCGAALQRYQDHQAYGRTVKRNIAIAVITLVGIMLLLAVIGRIGYDPKP